MSALFELTHALSAVTEMLDRKAAYAMACFSLYVAVISAVLGVLATRTMRRVKHCKPFSVP